MRSMQELFFGWAGWDGTLRLPNVFVTEKEHNFQTDENIELLHLKRKKKKLIYLNSRRYFVVHCLNTSKKK